MDLQTMRTEVMARGQDHVVTSFLDRWINLAYQDVNDRYAWPFLVTTTTGTAPITIADFGHGLSVLDTTNNVPIEWEDPRTIRERDPDLAISAGLAGAPESWYYEGTQVKVWPVSTTASLAVTYAKVPADLALTTDTPLSPARFHYLYVEAACGWAYQRAGLLDQAAEYFNRYEEGIQKMCSALMVPNYDTPAVVLQTESTDW